MPHSRKGSDEKSRQPTQETQPKGKDDEGKPAKPEAIPVPKRGEFFRDLTRLATPGQGPSSNDDAASTG